MERELVTYTGQHSDMVPAAGAAPPFPAEEPALVIQDAISRRWLTILSIWLICCAIAVPHIWLTQVKQYNSTAELMFQPVVSSIMYPDETTGPVPFFAQHLSTQQKVMESSRVLKTALDDPTVKELPIRQTEDPVFSLRRALKVENVAGTNLLRVSVAQENPEASVALTNAVVNAYMTTLVTNEAEETEQKRSVLEEQLAQIKELREGMQERIRKLGEEYGTASDTTFDMLRQGLIETTKDTKKELDRADLEIIQIEEQMRQVERGILPENPKTDALSDREKRIEEDPAVKALEQQLQEVSGRLAQLTTILTDEHREVKLARERKQWIENQLQEQRTLAETRVGQELQSREGKLLEQKRLQLQQQLAAVQHRREVLAQRAELRDNEGMALGIRGLEIRALRDRLTTINQEYDQVNQRLKALGLESRRPMNVTITSPAEFHPDNILDKRPKRTILAVLGSLILATFVGLLRDWRDTSLHKPQQIETFIGLPILGVVPRLKELHAGKVQQDDFVESYRIVRASLAGISSDGTPPRTILVTSAHPEEGKTSLAVSLAASLAEPGARVLLIDGDVQGPQIGQMLKLPRCSGLKELLDGKHTLVEAVLPSSLKGVDVLACDLNGGTARGALNHRSATRVIDEAIHQYDHVVIDSPPTLGAADAMVWARIVDSVVISCLAGHSDREAVKAAIARLRTVTRRVTGVVVGNVSVRDGQYSTSELARTGATSEPAEWIVTTIDNDVEEQSTSTAS